MQGFFKKYPKNVSRYSTKDPVYMGQTLVQHTDPRFALRISQKCITVQHRRSCVHGPDLGTAHRSQVCSKNAPKMYHSTAQKLPCIWAKPWYNTQIPGSLKEYPKNVSRYSTEDPVYMGQTLVQHTDPRFAPRIRQKCITVQHRRSRVHGPFLGTAHRSQVLSKNAPKMYHGIAQKLPCTCLKMCHGTSQEIPCTCLKMCHGTSKEIPCTWVRPWYITQIPGPLLVPVAPCLQVCCGSNPMGYEIKCVLSWTCGCTYSMPWETHNEPVLVRLGQTLLSTCTKQTHGHVHPGSKIVFNSLTWNNSLHNHPESFCTCELLA